MNPQQRPDRSRLIDRIQDLEPRRGDVKRQSRPSVLDQRVSSNDHLAEIKDLLGSFSEQTGAQFG